MEPVKIAKRFSGDSTSVRDAVTVASVQAIRQLLESLWRKTGTKERNGELDSVPIWHYFEDSLLINLMKSSAQGKAKDRYNERHGHHIPRQKLFTYPADLLLFASQRGHLASDTTRILSTTDRGESLPQAVMPTKTVEEAARCDDSDQEQAWIVELRTSFLEPPEVHQPLPSTEWIRLIVIEPGSFEDSLYLKLIPVQLSWAKGRYEALSYCWQETWKGRTELFTPFHVRRQKHRVFVNGLQVYIDEHLTRGLQHIRHASQYRALWVDALCINQKNSEERKQQVSIMDRIYADASRTLIWLGSSRETETTNGLDLLCRLVNSWDEDQPAQYSVFDPDTKKSETRRPQQEVTDRTIQQNFRDLNGVFGYRWFERRWVIQEVVLSRSADVLIGHFRISWRWIGLASALIRAKYTALLDSSNHSYFRHRAMNAYLMYRLSSNSDLPLVELSLLQMLRLTSSFQNSERLDSIYALRGLASNLRSKDTLLQLGVDYTRTETELRILLANSLMTEERLPLDFLTEAGLWSGDKTGTGRFLDTSISWLPRLNTRKSRCLLGPWELGGAFKASSGLQFMREPRDDSNRLCIHGLVVSTVLWRGEGLEFFTSSASGYGAVFALLGSRALARGGGTSSEYLADMEQNLELLARVLTAGRDLQDRREKNPKAYLGSLEAGLALYRSPFTGQGAGVFIPGKFKENASPTSFAEIAEKVGFNRTLFVTMHGHLGIGPIEMQSGDEICILGGASMPFVLRKAASDAGETFHRLIGECYVDGVMDGEAVIAMKEQRSHWGPLQPRRLLEKLYGFPSLNLEGYYEIERMKEECLKLNERMETEPASVMIELR